ncbi:MAG: DUF4198 domain-containing protein [Rhodobacteraceae bacterium]|nr:DUF4198 domain-containing protein [Paracoccaceae bacterium]
MNILTKLPAHIAFFAVLLTATVAHAHEYWIQPHQYRIEIGENIVADVRVGQDFRGNTLAYFPNNFSAFEVTDPSGTHPIEGRIGDMPAADIPTTINGLHVLSQFTTTSQLTYDDYAKFERFILKHGMDWVLAAHAERGLPDDGFAEGYTRFVKALVAVGDGAGADHFEGMFFEMVALKNPYTDNVSTGLPVMILFRGEPLTNTQIDIFYRADGDATLSHVVTGADGSALIPNQGDGEYMINAVHMIIPFEEDIARTGIVWHSLWASMTYRLGR